MVLTTPTTAPDTLFSSLAIVTLNVYFEAIFNVDVLSTWVGRSSPETCEDRFFHSKLFRGYWHTSARHLFGLP
jgi:hypothetical protein